MRVLVCGGRDFCDIDLLTDSLNDLHAEHRFTLLIEGGAAGADIAARAWGLLAGLPVATFEAEWDKHGRAAGPIRNKRMLIEGKPDVVVAFPGGKGTANMVKQAEDAGVKVIDMRGE